MAVIEKDAHVKVANCRQSLENIQNKTAQVLQNAREAVAELNSEIVTKALDTLQEYVDTQITPLYQHTAEHYDEIQRESRKMEGV